MMKILLVYSVCAIILALNHFTVGAHQEPISFSLQNVGRVGKCGSFNECPGMDGRSVCCPFTNGVCCGSRLFPPLFGFCCPRAYSCGRQGHCSKNEDTQDLYYKPRNEESSSMSSIKLADRRAQITCPDGKSHCQDGTTCCQMPTGQYGCCPYPKAVCCQDHEHCCPEHTTCNEAEATCERSLSSTEAPERPRRKIPARPRSLNTSYIVCADGASECEDNQTCCLMQDSTYGCCPLPKAQCCKDGVHCCPEGTQCNDESSLCERKSDMEVKNMLTEVERRMRQGAFEVPEALSARWREQPEVSTSRTPTGSRPCGRGESMCHDWETCCRYPNGSWGCCPLSDASCCPNGLSCCPHGYLCDESSQHCNPIISRKEQVQQNTRRQPRTLKPMPKRLADPMPKSIICSDGISVCPDDYTCCVLQDGSWGCCPLPRAVCCDDHIHCCPTGYVCEAGSGSCDLVTRGTGLFFHRRPFSKKMTSEQAMQGRALLQPLPTQAPPSVTSSVCQAFGLPTCGTGTGSRCCPFKEGTCCSTGEMCCPKGFSCSADDVCVRNQIKN